jgi:hypothetical protein
MYEGVMLNLKQNLASEIRNKHNMKKCQNIEGI